MFAGVNVQFPTQHLYFFNDIKMISLKAGEAFLNKISVLGMKHAVLFLMMFICQPSKMVDGCIFHFSKNGVNSCEMNCLNFLISALLRYLEIFLRPSRKRPTSRVFPFGGLPISSLNCSFRSPSSIHRI